MSDEKSIDQAFLREVDEELRRERLTGWWQRWGKIAVAVVGIGLIVLAASLWWREQRVEAAGDEAIALTQAFDDLDRGQEKAAVAALDKLHGSNHVAYRAASVLTEADVALKNGKVDDAIARFKTVAQGEDMPKSFRDLALVRMTALEFDKLKPDDVITRLKPLAVEGGPWFGSAGEMVAIAYMNQNKPELAGPLLAAIARDPQVPPSLRTRTAQLAGQLGVDAMSPVPGAETAK